MLHAARKWGRGSRARKPVVAEGRMAHFAVFSAKEIAAPRVHLSLCSLPLQACVLTAEGPNAAHRGGLQVDEEMHVLLANLWDMVEAELAAKAGKKKKKGGKKGAKVGKGWCILGFLALALWWFF